MGHAFFEYVFSDFVHENIENDVKWEEVKIDLIKNLQTELVVLVENFDKEEITIVKEEFEVEVLFGIGLVNVLLSACAQNLSGVEHALDQWEQIIQLTRSKNFLPSFNHASKSFVSGSWDVDAAANLRDMDLYSD
ncbi:hypothetical protein Dsin_022408 [Dipteronia sinensis]|uniref:Aminotransferase class I/classII large domain-containing protein n=1 Tax=Dipteronia sinensis TaxID=43782 RepID=A0AAE0A1P1_9ROSI|nr:hypothetical protein Dsin_022408 [Dipteronia sinensis]